MSSPFDGMAGVLNDVFGAPVTHTKPGLPPRSLRGVFREKPVIAEGEDGGDVLVMSATLKVLASDAAGISRNDWIDPKNGKTYRVVAAHDGGSPAADRFTTYILEERQ